MDIIENRPSPETYNELRKAVGWKENNIDDIKEGLRNSLFCVVALDDSKTIGMGRIVGDGKLIFYIQDLIVVPEFQKKGIGTQIMAILMNYINSEAGINSTVGLMSALGKENFYKKYSFQERPNKKLGSGMTIFNEISELI